MGETLFHRLLDDEGFGSEGLYVNVSSGRRLGSTHPLLLPLVSCSMVVAVLVGGALVFRQLEQLAEREEAEAFLALQKELREKFETMQEEHLVLPLPAPSCPVSVHKQLRLSGYHSQELFHRYISLSEKYMSTRSTAPDDDNLNWTFMGSLYFCMTVITTIGYGSYTPITKGGKCFLMIYALVGIPCFIVMLTIVSEAVLRPIKKFAKVSARRLWADVGETGHRQ